jgi:hypothetical protein
VVMGCKEKPDVQNDPLLDGPLGGLHDSMDFSLSSSINLALVVAETESPIINPFPCTVESKIQSVRTWKRKA